MSEEQKLSLQDFKANFTVTIARYEVYPKEQPSCYCVGLILKHNEGKGEKYIDTQVPLTQTVDKTENEIVKLGFDNMQSVILDWATSIHNKPAIVGSQLTL